MTIPPLPYAAPVLPRGAQPGRRNRLDQTKQETLKEAILLAAAYVGDEMASDAAEKGNDRPGGLMGYLEMVARADVKAFCSLLGRVLPMQVTGENGGALEVVFKTVYEEKPPAAP